MPASPKSSSTITAEQRRIRHEEPSDPQGFTLIELLVVIIILGILVAVAIPIFIRQTNLAREGSAESMLRSLGTGAYAGMVESRAASDFTEQIDDVTGSAVIPRYPKTSDTASSKNDKDVVAKVDVDIEEKKNPKPPSQWLAAVAPRPGRCTIVNVTATTGMVASRTVDAPDGTCKADLGTTITLNPSDFMSRALPVSGGKCIYIDGKCVDAITWNGTTVTMPYASMLLNTPTSTQLRNGSISANVKLAAGSNGTGLVFRGNQSDKVGNVGGLNGFVYQIDPGLKTNGRPSMVIRQWIDGKENTDTLMRVAVPANLDITAAQNLQIDLSGDNYIAKLNGVEVGRGTLPPGYTGSSYGVRTWTPVPNQVSDMKITPTP